MGWLSDSLSRLAGHSESPIQFAEQGKLSLGLAANYTLVV